jgi:Lon protease-like protein
MVLAKEEGIANAGCTVIVEKVIEKYPDGRLDILTRGQRRFEILSLNDDKDYLQAEVNFFEDDDLDQPPEDLRVQALTHYQALVALPSARERGDPILTDPQLSFQLAQSLPDLDFLNILLRQRSETRRLKQLNTYLAEYIPRQRNIERIKALVPNNGFGGKPAGV